MAGVRRRLRDVGTKITGVLAGARDEGAAPTDATSPPTDEPAQEDTAVTATDVTADRPTGPGPGPGSDRRSAGAPDPLCAAAIDLARAAAVEVAGPSVGEHVGVDAEPGDPGDHVVTHSFAAHEPGYTGWRWAVTVARAEGSDQVTVDELVLLPGSGALLAPAWVPWSERVAPGDLAPGDLLPPAPDDPRLVPSYADVDAEELPHALHRELGLGRPRVLSAEGRADAALRWEEGDGGPDTPTAKAAPGRCGDCGFLVPLAGALGRGFGACANAFSPDDGRVVSLLHGCGAHSETVVELTHVSGTAMAVGEDELELVSHRSDEEPGDGADS